MSKKLKMSESTGSFGSLGGGDDDDGDFDNELYDSGGAFGGVADDDLPAAGVGLTRARSYEVLDEATIITESKALIKSVQELCGLPRWNKEKLIDKWMENSEKVLEKAGITSGDLTSQKKSDRKKTDCLICLEPYASKNSYALGCGHRYCNECWARYLQVALKSAAGVASTRCPAPKCGALVHEDAFQAHCSKEDYERYLTFVRRSFVDSNPKAKWCPAPRCRCAIRVERASRLEPVTCTCGLSFCFQCADASIGDHSPASCADIERWLRKASDESENLTWMMANTKKCPKCRSPIEKNGGCMHMTCTTASCRYEFCWLCRGSWKEHGQSTGGYYNCNKYDKDKDAVAEDLLRANAKTELDKYMFFYHRYESHHNARKVADQQRLTCQTKEAQVLAKFGVRSADTKFMLECTEQLLTCRRILEFSYVYGYNLVQTKADHERSLFEYLQEDVEKHTNELSEAYEKELKDLPDYQSFIEWKERVTNLTRVCHKFVGNFSEGVRNGLTH